MVGSSECETYTMYRETCTSELLFHEILAVRLLPLNIITVKFMLLDALGVQTTVINVHCDKEKHKSVNKINLEN